MWTPPKTQISLHIYRLISLHCLLEERLNPWLSRVPGKDRSEYTSTQAYLSLCSCTCHNVNFSCCRLYLFEYSCYQEARMLLLFVLTLKAPRKSASENVIFLSSAEYSCKLFKRIFAYKQTVWTQIRLLLKELGPHCLQK